MKLKEKYEKEVRPALAKRFAQKSPMAIPRIEKVVVHTGFGKLLANKTGDDRRKTEEAILLDMASLAGQKPSIRKAKAAIAGFKTRKGMPMGAKVTLRKNRMYDFLEKVLHVVLARSRDFRGLDKASVDPMGNLTIGIKEHIFFPEISPEKVRTIFGLEITVVTSAKTREEALELFHLLGFPFITK